MERRNAQVFDVETTISDESEEVSTPTVVVSAAPLQPCVRTSAPTVRMVAVSRLPGTALGTVPPAARRARMWVIEEPLETAPVGAIPMPGERVNAVSPRAPMWSCERSSGAVTAVATRAARELAPSTAAATRALPLGTRASDVATIGVARHAPRAPMRACEPPAQYSVEREVAEITTRRAAAPRKHRAGRRAGHALILVIGILAGLMTVLSVVVFRQQRDMQSMAAPAQRADEACAAYAGEVRALALGLTQAAGDVAAVERRIGERARGVVSDRAMQRLCSAPIGVACSVADAGCVAAAVMQLRQALARR